MTNVHETRVCKVCYRPILAGTKFRSSFLPPARPHPSHLPRISCNAVFGNPSTQPHVASQIKHQLDATLCRFYFCRATLHVSGASAHYQEYLKLVQRPLARVLSLQVSHHKLNAFSFGPNKVM